MLPHVASSHQVPRWAPALVRCDRVRAAAAEFQALADRLLIPAPLPARGVAQARLLLGDEGGPLYRRTSRDDLRGRWPRRSGPWTRSPAGEEFQ